MVCIFDVSVMSINLAGTVVVFIVDFISVRPILWLLGGTIPEKCSKEKLQSQLAMDGGGLVARGHCSLVCFCP